MDYGFLFTALFIIWAIFYGVNCAYFAAERRWDTWSILYRFIPLLNIYSFFKFKMWDI